MRRKKNMAKILVVGTRSYDFTNEEGKAVRGSKAYSFRKGEDGGLIPVKVSFRNVYTAGDMFPVPGIYEVELGFGGTVEDATLEDAIDINL